MFLPVLLTTKDIRLTIIYTTDDTYKYPLYAVRPLKKSAQLSQYVYYTWLYDGFKCQLCLKCICQYLSQTAMYKEWFGFSVCLVNNKY